MNKQLDFIGQVLYGHFETQLFSQRVKESAQRMWKMTNQEDCLRIAEMALDKTSPRFVKIVAFFVLLNKDTALKDQIQDLGANRAQAFYTALDNHIIPEWMQDETKGIGNIVEKLRFEYRNA